MLTMEPKCVDDLVGRMDRLERENRRLKLGVAASLLAFGLSALIAARPADPIPPPEVAAKRFAVRDGAGRDRIALGVDKEGRASLDFLDQSGSRRLALSVAKAGVPTVEFLDRDGKGRITMA